MEFEITNTRQARPQKVVIYGPEGIGKTTFASQFPDPLFIDTDDRGTSFIDAKRLPYPKDWDELLNEVNFVATKRPAKTLVLDTMDKSELMAKEWLLKKHNWKIMDAAGYGTKFVAWTDEIIRLLNGLNLVTQSGINVVVVAHAKLVKREQPDEVGRYDRWELKLDRDKNSALLKEWADLLLFADYKTTVVTDSNGHGKAQGGQRVMYTTHKPSWDAKNRLGLNDQLPFSYDAIKEPLEKVMGLNEQPPAEPGNGEVPSDILTKMIGSQIKLADLQAILYQGKFATPGTPMSQVPPATWQHINDHWSDAMKFYRTKILGGTTNE